MRKSSLGRRSSTHIPVRVPSLGSSSGLKTCSGSKRSTGSLLKQPGFTQMRGRRSQSEDRESYGGRSLVGSMVRSATSGALPGRGQSAMTPKTPRMSVHSNLPTGSIRAPRSQTMSTESNRRMSSFGGTKNVRKDSRPIGEKPFQQAAQAKVQQYFDVYGSQVLGTGNSIRPMNTKLFVDMMDHLLKNFDSRIFITKSNYLEELPQLLRKWGYRSKVDKSWLMTVNTPHSWQYVVAVLSWLVEAIECMKSVDGFEMMYTNNIREDNDEQEEEDEDDISMNKEVIVHLKKVYRIRDDPNFDELADKMHSEFIDKQIEDLKCTDENFEVLKRGIDLIMTEVNEEEQRRNAQLELLERVQAMHRVLKQDYEQMEEYKEESIAFVQTTEKKLVTMDQEIAAKKILLTKKQEELRKLQEKVNCQQISMVEKDKIIKEKHELQRMIQFYDNSIREYEKSAFTVDLKLAEDQRKVEKLILEYNKLVAESTIVELRLKDVQVNFSLMSKNDDELLKVVDQNLKVIQDDYKNSLHSLESRKEQSENTLWKVKQEEKETQEEISKETPLLAEVELELEKQEDLIKKETQKLKNDQQHYQRLTKKIAEEISHFAFDPVKLENKKQELLKVEHDWQLLQKRSNELLKAEMELNKTMMAKVEVAIIKRAKRAKEFPKKHFNAK